MINNAIANLLTMSSASSTFLSIANFNTTIANYVTSAYLTSQLGLYYTKTVSNATFKTIASAASDLANYFDKTTSDARYQAKSNASATELGYLVGVTSPIQTQINNVASGFVGVDSQNLTYYTTTAGTNTLLALKMNTDDAYTKTETNNLLDDKISTGSSASLLNLSLSNNGGYSSIEMMGASGAYIDLRQSPGLDYSLRLVASDTYAIVSSKQDLLLYAGEQEKVVVRADGRLKLNSLTPSMVLVSDGGESRHGICGLG